MILNPLVTIVCSCYNHQDYVCKTLDSVMNQSYANIELIVVDDKSSDNSVEVIQAWLKKHPKVTFIQNSENLGITKSFNNAMKFAKGTYYMDLAADDILLPNCVDVLVTVYEKNSDAGIVFSNAEMIDYKDEFLHVYFDKERSSKIEQVIKQGNYYENLLRKSDVICSVSAMYKRSVFKDMSGYDERLYFEDLDFWLRVSRKYSVVFTNQILVQKRYLENSLEHAFFVKSHHTQNLYRSLYLVFEKAYHLNLQKSEFKALISRIYKQSKWAIRTFNVKYIFLYFKLFVKTLAKLV